MVPLELWGPERNIQCMVKFDVADLAHPVVAPIDGPSLCGEIDMCVTEDSTCVNVGTAAEEAAAAVGTRVDEPRDDPPPPRPREVRQC